VATEPSMHLLNLKPYSMISCNVTDKHEENAVGFAET